ncbi:unnamed protein product [Prunus armeniaca]
MKFVSSAETESAGTTTYFEDSKSGRGISTMPRVVKRKYQKIKPVDAVDMAFVVGQGGKNLVLSSAAKKWKDFKSTLTRHYILPFIKEREKLS